MSWHERLLMFTCFLSINYWPKLAIIRQDGEYGLLHLIDICFEYRSSKSTSKDMSQLRKTEQREGSLFVPIATFDQALNVVDESFTFKFVGLLFQSFSIYHHAYSAGLVNDPNFLNSLMQKVCSSKTWTYQIVPIIYSIWQKDILMLHFSIKNPNHS